MDSLTLQSEILRHLKQSQGKDPEHATTYDWRMSLSLSLRDLIVEPWFESTRKTYQAKGKRVYYLSMEFLIGRLIEDVAVNIGLDQIASEALRALDQDYAFIVSNEPDAALGNGGLGRLAACFLDSLSTLGIPAYGYGIRYEHGLFEQHFSDGQQIETAETWLAQRHVWEFERPEVSYPVDYGGTITQIGGKDSWIPAETIMASAYDTPIVGWQMKWANTLRLWAAKPTLTFDLERFNQGDYLEASAPEAMARTISRVLYPDDTTEVGKELRLKQEYFFTSASIQDILRRALSEGHALETLADHVAIQLNDTHPAVAGPELIRLLVDDHGIQMSRAIVIARDCLGFTNHTLLPEALEQWPEALFSRVLPRHYQIIKNIQAECLDKQGIATPIIEKGAVKMGELAFVMAHRVNGVSALHTELIKNSLFNDLHKKFPLRIVNKTNGITPRRWLYHSNPPLRQLINETIGCDWVDDLEQLKGLEPYVDDSAFLDAFGAAKRANKQRLTLWLKERTGMQINPESLFDIQIKRVHEYKRQLMNILETISYWNDIKDNPGSNWVPRVKIFAGKAAPGYVAAKSIIHLINDVARVINSDSDSKDVLQVVFPENYNVSMAEIMIPAADLSEQISTAGKEASGTGNMKLSLNGALTIGTLDGANVEIRDKVSAENFFLFGLTASEAAERQQQPEHARQAIESSARLSRVLKQITDGVFSNGDPKRFASLIQDLHENDYFLVTEDFDAYFETQRNVDVAYANQKNWMKMAALNTARLGWFSSDRTVQSYADDIWHVQSLLSGPDDLASQKRA